MEDGLNLLIHEHVFASSEEIFERLENEIVYLPEEECQIRIRNKSYPISRKIAAFGDPDLSYTFSGLTLISQPWPPLLLEIKSLIESIMGVSFNFVLINRYEDGNACIGQHKDDEADLEENHPICSLSFGETRTMIFKRPNYQDKKVELKSNSLLVMNPPTNKFWSHGIPKEKKHTGVRINLTFRMMKTSGHNKRKRVQTEESCKKIKEDRNKDEMFTENAKEWADSLDMKYLGGENFLTVNHFIGKTRVHIRRYVKGENGELHATKDGVSLSPKVWYSLCTKVNAILNHKSSDKVFIIDRDLCISKQMKNNQEIFVFQRLFQRRNLSMQFLSEYVVVSGAELGKLCDNKCLITDRVKQALITYTLSYCIGKELDKPNLQLKPVENPDAFLELLVSLQNCLAAAITVKITELTNCFGCRDSYEANFMHDCLTKSRSEKWSEYFHQALFSINWDDVARDIVHKNLNIDFQAVLGVEEFFPSLDVEKTFEAVEKMYVGEENEAELIFNELLFSCN